MCGTPLPSLLTLQNPTFCPSCHKKNKPEARFCQHCGGPVSPAARIEAEAVEATEEALQNSAVKKNRQDAQAAAQEANRQAAYQYSTGEGVCPSCKSPNVRSKLIKEGANLFGINLACCAGCFLTPLALLLLPFMGGKKVREYQCQYCSNRWRL